MRDLKEMLLVGAAELGVALDDVAIDRLFVYKDFLQEYNKKVNLTSITEDEEVIVKHFLDSLAVLPEIKTDEGTKVIDIGTGAGFPGLALKIAQESLDLVLMDSTNKKVKFLEEAVQRIGLNKVVCIHARAEELLRQKMEYQKSFDYAVSRAVARLSKLAGYCLPYVKIGGEFIAMKGRNYSEELDEARDIIKKLGGEVVEVKEIALPGDIIHSLIKIKKKYHKIL